MSVTTTTAPTTKAPTTTAPTSTGVTGASAAPHGDVLETRWRAMGTDVHVVVVGGDRGHLALARNRIDALERRWSRFRDDSEVSLLNAADGEPTAVSADTVLLVESAQEAWRLTGGAFDPTLLHELRAAGYDRSFEQIGPRDRPAPAAFVHRRALVVDVEISGHVITLPRGLGFDAGGIGKGLAADLVSSLLLDAGAAGCCVNLGGDLRVRGGSPEGDGWTIGVEHPAATRPIATLGLREGAVATSTVLRRRWWIDGTERHHLIDPATGEPATSDVALATVVTGEAWMAEVLATAALLRGTARAFDLLDRHSAGLVVDHDGYLRTSERFGAFVGATRPSRDVWAA